MKMIFRFEFEKKGKIGTEGIIKTVFLTFVAMLFGVK